MATPRLMIVEEERPMPKRWVFPVIVALVAALPSPGRAAEPNTAYGAGYFFSFSTHHERFLAIEVIPDRPPLAYYRIRDTESRLQIENYVLQLDCTTFSTSITGFPQVQASGSDLLDPSKRFHLLVIDRSSVDLGNNEDIVDVVRQPEEGSCGAPSVGFPTGSHTFTVTST